MPSPRPPRLRVKDELGRVRTLDAGTESRVCLWQAPASAPLLVLGAGPEPAAFDDSARPVFWIDCPDFITQMPPSWSVPPQWQRVPPSDLKKHLLHSEIWQYRAAPKLFPSFWGPILGELTSSHLAASSRISSTKIPPRAPEATNSVVILPRTTLMHRELVEAFAAHGLRTRSISNDPAKAATETLEILRNETVALFLSLNFEGLDANGELFYLLRTQKIPVAAWLADNPWHVLSRIQQPWWRGVRLFVTDASFVEPLRAHGAEHISHLPLAAWAMPAATSLSTSPIAPTPLPPQTPPIHQTSIIQKPYLTPSTSFITFVGHSRFPQRERFFSGLTLPAQLWEEALCLLATATPPDLLWWQRHLNTTDQWPGLGCRLAGYGAERAALERRTRFLEACLPLGLTIYGDEGWSAQLAITPLPPLDYYTALGTLYAQSRYSLNVTSLQLPAGLTQRHFDVWQAGGFLLTDRSPGLELFPRELTEPISAACPSDIPKIVSHLERDPALRRDLMGAWQCHIQKNHTYIHRVEQFLRPR